MLHLFNIPSKQNKLLNNQIQHLLIINTQQQRERKKKQDLLLITTKFDIWLLSLFFVSKNEMFLNPII